jgi:type I restriction enzyme S subunit
MVKPGYKQTEVGVIPEDWDLGLLNDCLQSSRAVRYGIVQPGKFNEGGCLMLRSQDYSKGWSSPERMHRVNGLLENQYKNARLKRGDLVMTVVGAGIGQVVTVPSWLDGGILSRSTARIAVDHAKAAPPYVKAFLEGPIGRRQVLDCQKEGAQPVVSCRDLGRFIFIFPQLPEQQAIATALADADELIGSLEQLLTKKRQIKQGAMQELLSGKKRLPGFTGEWEVRKLGDLGEVTGSGVDKKIHEDEIPVRLVNYMDVYRRDFIHSKDLNHWVTAPSHKHRRCAVQRGDIFFTPSSETRDDIAHTAVAMEDIADAVYSYHVVRLRLSEEWDLKFRTYAFKTHEFMSQAETICDGGGTRYVISLGKFREMTVRVPSLPEQTAIAEVLSDMDAEIEALETKLTKARQVKQGMLQELLTGRIRLV